MSPRFLIFGLILSLAMSFSCSNKEITAKVTKRLSLGTEITYYINGKEVSKRMCDVYDVCSGSNIPDGVVNFSDEENRTSFKGTYSNNKREGKFVYYENGKLKTEANYDHDKLYGIGRVYYENGKVSTETNYRNGKPDGLMKTYYEDGTLKEEATYKDGKINGLLVSYYKNGKVEVEKTLKNGQMNGPSKHYDEDGDLEEEVYFVNGVTDGLHRMFYKNGKVKEEETYAHGEKISVRTYDETGNIVSSK